MDVPEKMLSGCLIHDCEADKEKVMQGRVVTFTLGGAEEYRGRVCPDHVREVLDTNVGGFSIGPLR